MKHLLSGNEAAARGAYEAGVKVCSAYPSTPSTEIFENLPQYKDSLYCEWAPNEKVATEVAIGATPGWCAEPHGYEARGRQRGSRPHFYRCLQQGGPWLCHCLR